MFGGKSMGQSFSSFYTPETKVERIFAWLPKWLDKEQRWCVMEHCWRVNGLETQFKDKYFSEHTYKVQRLLGEWGKMWGA